MKAINHLLLPASSLIDLKAWVDKMVVHQVSGLRTPTRLFSLKDGFVSQWPFVSKHINTSKILTTLSTTKTSTTPDKALNWH